MTNLEKNFKVCLGQTLRSKRRELGLSVRTLARRANLHHNLIYAYERGEVTPNVYNAYVIVNSLGWSIDDWVLGAESLLANNKTNDGT